MSDHAIWEERICAALDGELSAAEEAALRAHLDECEDCRAFYAAMEAVGGLAGRDLPEAPADFSAKVMERVRAEAKKERKKPKVVRFPYKPLAAAAAAALVLWAGSGLLGALRPKGASSAAPAAAGGAMQAYSVTAADEAAPAESVPEAPEAEEPMLFASNSTYGAVEEESLPEPAGEMPMADFDAAAPAAQARDAGAPPCLTLRGDEIDLDGETLTLEELAEHLEALDAAETGVTLELDGADDETAQAVCQLLEGLAIPVL